MIKAINWNDQLELKIARLFAVIDEEIDPTRMSHEQAIALLRELSARLDKQITILTAKTVAAPSEPQ